MPATGHLYAVTSTGTRPAARSRYRYTTPDAADFAARRLFDQRNDAEIFAIPDTVPADAKNVEIMSRHIATVCKDPLDRIWVQVVGGTAGLLM